MQKQQQKLGKTVMKTRFKASKLLPFVTSSFNTQKGQEKRREILQSYIDGNFTSAQAERKAKEYHQLQTVSSLCYTIAS